MAEFVEVMKQRDRMHKHFMENDACRKCPISSVVNGKKELCFDFVCRHFEEAEKIIMDWAKEHPMMTNTDKFEKVFGFKPNNNCCPFTADDVCAAQDCCEGCPRDNFWDKEWKDPKEKADDN